MTVTPEQVLAQIRYSVSYQVVRHPTTFPEVGAAAARLVQSKAFADFVADVLEVVAPPPAVILDEEIHDGHE